MSKPCPGWTGIEENAKAHRCNDGAVDQALIEDSNEMCRRCRTRKGKWDLLHGRQDREKVEHAERMATMRALYLEDFRARMAELGRSLPAALSLAPLKQILAAVDSIDRRSAWPPHGKDRDTWATSRDLFIRDDEKIELLHRIADLEP